MVFFGGKIQPMANRIFLLQKRVTRIMMGADSRFSCKGSFKKLDALPVPCEYVFPLLILIITNFNKFLTITAVHGVNTKTNHQLHRPTLLFSCIHRDVLYSGIKIIYRLPAHILELKNEAIKLMEALRKYLIIHVFILLMRFYLAVKLLSLLDSNNDGKSQ
jgi:hypothetical protein